MYVRHEGIRACAKNGRIARERTDRFVELVREVHEDPDNAYNLDRYLWVLEQPPTRACAACGDLFDPWLDYAGGPARGLPRRHCSRACAQRAGWERHWARRRAGERWGSAA